VRERLQQAVTRIDALTLRERALLMLAVLAVLVGLWEVLLFGPLQQQHTALRNQVQTLHDSVAALNRTITRAANKRAEDPNVALRAQLETVNAENTRLDARLNAITAGLVAPREMATVLERVLKAQHGLKLVSIANLPAEAVALGEDDESATAKVFRHGLTLTFEGDYLDTLKYLQALSRLPWHFYWDRLDLKVTDYPVSRVTVTVHTLNLKEGWIGV
jgi:MSHA biogenesis protein MshJ